MSYTITYFQRGVDLRFFGPTDSAEIYEANSAILAHTYEGSLAFELIDFTETTRFDVDSAFIERIAEQDRAYVSANPPFAVCVSAPRDLIFGLGRVYEGWIEGSGITTRVVKTREQAVSWLREQGFPDISA